MKIILKKVCMFFFEENLVWQQNFTKTYLESVELLLTLVFSTDELQLIVSIDLHNIRSSECYQHATKTICQDQDLWEKLDFSLHERLEPWLGLYRDKPPFEICTILSQRENDMELRELSALFWGLLRRGIQCPAKLYQYAYQRCRYLSRRKFALRPTQQVCL